MYIIDALTNDDGELVVIFTFVLSCLGAVSAYLLKSKCVKIRCLCLSCDRILPTRHRRDRDTDDSENTIDMA